MEIPDSAIRPMHASDIGKIIKIYSESFSNSRSTKLGPAFLRKMYRWYVIYQPRLSFVATLNDEVVGFVTGAIGGGTARRRFRYAFWQIVLGFLRRPQLLLRSEMFEAWQIHLRGLLTGAPRTNLPQVGHALVVKVTLDSIAVAPDARGKDVGRLLVSAFEKAAWEQGATFIGLGVESDNVSARHFYERCGWQLARDNVEHNSANYTKELQMR